MPVLDVRSALARIDDLERKLDRAESDASGEVLGPELDDAARALQQQIDVDKAAMAAQRSTFTRGHGFFARHFSANARDEYGQTVGKTERQLEVVESGAHRLHQLRGRFYDDKTRVHAREFIRIAEKVQKKVSGDWDEKALTAAAAWLAGSSGDDVITAHDAFHSAARTAPAIVQLAALLAGGAPAAGFTKERAEALAARAAALAPLCQAPARFSDDVLAAAVLCERSVDDVRAMLAALAARGLLPKDVVGKDAVCAAALLSKHTPSSAVALIGTLAGALTGTWDGPGLVIAAALLAGKDAAFVVAHSARVVKALAGAEGTSAVIAAGLLAGREADDVVSCARALTLSVTGTAPARIAITAAGVLSGRSAPEVLAFTKHVQSQLSGTWESEATVIAAGLLGAPGHAASALVRAAFLLPGLTRAVDDDDG